ncbi:MAG: hypothetical protein GXY24_05280 [Bacteroidales bacterium]|jgi:hypothetical protein|nr:hypothetical protein [Bacteroidales bacterium]
MKKILMILGIAASVLMISCQKDPVENTATMATAGQWYVQIDGVDASGNLPDESYADIYGLGNVMFLTFNTAANKADEMMVSDLGDFWDFQIVVKCDQNALTFGNTAEVENLSYDCNVLLTNGKITLNGAQTPSGKPADAIEFDITFDDDDAPAMYGFDHYKVHGYRYTGLANDN